MINTDHPIRFQSNIPEIEVAIARKFYDDVVNTSEIHAKLSQENRNALQYGLAKKVNDLVNDRFFNRVPSKILITGNYFQDRPSKFDQGMNTTGTVVATVVVSTVMIFNQAAGAVCAACVPTFVALIVKAVKGIYHRGERLCLVGRAVLAFLIANYDINLTEWQLQKWFQKCWTGEEACGPLKGVKMSDGTPVEIPYKEMLSHQIIAEHVAWIKDIVPCKVV